MRTAPGGTIDTGAASLQMILIYFDAEYRVPRLLLRFGTVDYREML